MDIPDIPIDGHTLDFHLKKTIKNIVKGIIFHVFASFVLIFIIMLLIGAIPSRQVMPNMYTYF